MISESVKRTEWQRSDATMLFTEVAAVVFPAVIDRISDEQLAVTAGSVWCLHSLDKAREVAKLLIDDEYLENILPLCVPQLTQFTAQALLNYTFAGDVTRGMKEALETISAFPINALFAAGEQVLLDNDRDYGDIFPNIGTVAGVVRAPWFRDFCHKAAFADNGVWKRMSAAATNGTDQVRRGFLVLEKTSVDMYSFTFSEHSLRALRRTVQDRNRQAAFIARGGEDTDSAYNGLTTSGCPVAHHRAQYGTRIPDEQQMEYFEQAFGKTTEDLLATRERTGIDIGLDALADLLDRAHNLEVRKS